MPSELDRLLGAGRPLSVEPPDAKEIEGLIRSGRRRLKDAGNLSLAVESRFDLAYNAAHALCLAALRRKGFRSSNRFIVFQVSPRSSLGAARMMYILIIYTGCAREHAGLFRRHGV